MTTKYVIDKIKLFPKNKRKSPDDFQYGFEQHYREDMRFFLPIIFAYPIIPICLMLAVLWWISPDLIANRSIIWMLVISYIAFVLLGWLTFRHIFKPGKDAGVIAREISDRSADF